MIQKQIDLRNIEEFRPGNIINFRYFDYDGRKNFVNQKWSIEDVYRDHLFCSRICENGVLIKECFNTGTLIERGVLVEKA